jgi:hypothetical protein
MTCILLGIDIIFGAALLTCKLIASAAAVLCLQAFGVTLLCVAYNWVLVHNLARHHMLLFTSFLAMPSALIRSMASRPCTVRGSAMRYNRECDIPGA